MLDEVEELELVLDHYVIAWGVKDDAKHVDLLDWGLKQERALTIEENEE